MNSPFPMVWSTKEKLEVVRIFVDVKKKATIVFLERAKILKSKHYFHHLIANIYKQHYKQ